MYMLVVISIRHGTRILTRHATNANASQEIIWRQWYGDTDIEMISMEEAAYVGA